MSDKLEGLKLVNCFYYGSNEIVAAAMIREFTPEDSKTKKDMMSLFGFAPTRA